MKITYLGHSCFLITGKSTNGNDVTVLIDPYDPKMVGLNLKPQDVDIAVTSHRGHGDHDYFENLSSAKSTGGENKPFIVDAPGEYEVSDLRIFGYQSFHDDKKGKERGKNTIFVFDFQDARVCHLGDLGHDLTSEYNELLEELNGIDVLMIPVGGKFTINPETAMSVIEKIEPKIVIPMHYKTSKHSDTFKDLHTIEDFLKEAGEKIEPQKDLVIKSKSDVPDELKIVVLGG